MEAVELDDKGNPYEIPFGKYRGLDITDIYESDQSYVEWIWDNMNLDSYPEFAKIVQNLVETGCPF